jgi:magnesium-transporting ATPase (P-type)
MILNSMPSNKKGSDLASASVPDTLAALHVDLEAGLTRAEVDARRKTNGFNEVIEQKGHPVLKFLGKFWGVSAWMPSKTLAGALTADALVGTVLTFAGLPGLLPLPWWQTLAIFIYAMVSCLVVNDAVKVAMIKWRVPATAA